MELIDYLLNNYEVDGDNDIPALWADIKKKYGRDDFVKLANIIVTLDQMDKGLLQNFWDNL